MKRLKVSCGILLLLMIVFVTLRIARPVRDCQQSEALETKEQRIDQTSPVLPEVEIPSELADSEGDPEVDQEPFTLLDPLDVPNGRSKREGFQDFMMEYAFSQNYTKDGFNLGYADDFYINGIEISDSAARISGMGTEGYLVWIIRNTFGICDPDFEKPIKVYEKSMKVKREDLQIGDIGFSSENEMDNFCGICVGFEGEEPVFSIMDGSWSEKFPFGTNRLCYLQDGKNEYIGSSQPIKLNYFCRPELPWQTESGDDLKGQMRWKEQIR